MFIFDSHTHCQYSSDAVSDLEGMCRFAIENGIDGFAVTDHCDGNWHDRPFETKRRESVAKEVRAMQEKYRGRLKITLGIELAQQDFNPDVTNHLVQEFESQNGDFLIGSMHRAGMYRDFSVIDFDLIDFNTLFEMYYHQMLTTAKLNHLDVLAHMTYPLRYAPKDVLDNLDMRTIDDIADEIFKVLIQNGKGIELNISGLRQAYGDTFPKQNYIKRFKELGGEIITIGSDSHVNTEVAKFFDRGVEIVKAAGFDYYCYFEQRKPVFVPFDK